MGFDTTVIVMNDALGTIAKDTSFGRKLSEAVAECGFDHPIDVSADDGLCCHVNAATVIETHHASGIAVVAIGGNCGHVLGYAYGVINDFRDSKNKVEILKQIAESMGYTIHKKRERHA